MPECSYFFISQAIVVKRWSGVGTGSAPLDGYLRANDVYHSRKNNDPNGERKAVVEAGSFGIGIGIGMIIGTVIAFTPVGLAIGIVVGGAAAVGVDYGVKEIVGWMYDQW